MNELITTKPGVRGGKPVIRGKRISIAFILQCIASGTTVEAILSAYPHLTKDGSLAAVDYAARIMMGDTIRFLDAE